MRPFAEGQIQHTLTGRAADVAKHLVRPCNRVWRQQNVVQISEAMRSDHRLHREAVKGCAGNATRLQQIIERILIDNAATSGVQQISIALHPLQLFGSDQSSSLII